MGVVANCGAAYARNIQVEYVHDGACMLGSEDGEADELLERILRSR